VASGSGLHDRARAPWHDPGLLAPTAGQGRRDTCKWRLLPRAGNRPRVAGWSSTLRHLQ